MHGDVGAAVNQCARNIGRERTLVREFPQRRGLILIAGGSSCQALHVQLGMGRTERALNQRRLQARQRAGAAQQPYAHRSCHPDGFSLTRVVKARAH
jgi:hypothetical protein